MNIQKILDKLIEKSNFRTGHMEDGKDVYDEIEVKVEDIKQSLEQAYKQGVNDSINSIEKGKEMGWNAGEIVQDLEDKLLLNLNGIYQDLQELKYVDGKLVDKEQRDRLSKLQDKLKKVMKTIC